MQLYIVRHAYAGQHGDPRYRDDSLRPLTTKGRKRFRSLVKKLSKRGFAPLLVATSPFTRCRQTAEIVAERAHSSPTVVSLDSLTPGSDLNALVAWSNEQGLEEIAWVGHAPDVNNLLAGLLACGADTFSLSKGAVASIAFDEEIELGKGELRWLVTQKILDC